jgi:hypothetical protein
VKNATASPAMLTTADSGVLRTLPPTGELLECH